MVAPGFRTRIATSLLVVAAALPVSLIAGPALAVDHKATPAARPDESLDAYTPDLPVSVERLARLYPDLPDVPDRLPDVPGADGLRDLPDRILRLTGALTGFPRHHAGALLHVPRHLHRHHPHPFGPDFLWRADPAPDPDDSVLDGPDADAPEPAEAPSPPAADPVQLPPSHPAPRRHHSAPSAAPKPHRAPPEAGLPSPSRPRDLAEGPAPSPHRQKPSPAPQPKPETTVAGPDPAASPYALDAPGTRVERVLPMGAGMALTGLGLAFLGLRLRRR
ncbi:hypothetical protein K2224_06180 [Streptomyces sp. BHT-5-2]|uniref:hypothetical protein n=1 Tax=Streptomyces sp. BHT-5-2 TaxID=2866715 RepID=UPI001C8F0273|nr:hypothetical protein [Streptomyces sp. BHT-5-2]QZL02856.1 hypothetical protein K2224_06180 [Streptomyces sp. BHT-5-2]